MFDLNELSYSHLMIYMVRCDPLYIARAGSLNTAQRAKQQPLFAACHRPPHLEFGQQSLVALGYG